jgi:tetratricopeptide (TPR) repeat protein
MSQGKIAEALPHLERARDINRDDPVAWHQLALGYFGLERKDDAIAAWQQAVRLNPRFEDAWFTMAIVLAANKREDDARNALRQVLALNPSRKDARDMLTALGGR